MRQLLISFRASVLLLTLVARPVFAGNGSIGLYFDLDCGTCSRTATIGVPFTLYVNATLDGGTAGGIVGADFRVVGMPTSWFTTVTPNSAASSLGNPLDAGCNIGFRACQTRACVNLCSILVEPTTLPVDVRLSVIQRATPVCQPYCAVFLTVCDPPFYTRYAVTGSTAILNGPPCVVATQPTSWSSVKELYRD